MNRANKLLDIYFFLLIVEMFTLTTLLILNFKALTLTDYLLFGMTFFIIIIAYFTSVLGALTTGLVLVFLYGSLLMYQSFSGAAKIEERDYFWIIVFPLTAFIAGKFSYFLDELKKGSVKLESQVENLVTIDEITGFPNAKAFYEQLEAEMSRAKRHKFNLVLMLVEVQYFEELITLYGKKKADEIIGIMADLLRKVSRMEDTRYRLSEKLFALIMPNTDLAGGEIVRNRLRKELASVVVGNKESYKLAMKIGILPYNETITDSFTFKNLAEKELEFDL